MYITIIIYVGMKQLAAIISLITMILMDFTDGQYPNCIDSCPVGMHMYIIVKCSRAFVEIP